MIVGIKFQFSFCSPQIFDLSDTLSKKEGEGAATVASSGEAETASSSASSSSSSLLVTSPLVTLSGHLLRVISLAWSPHEEGKLASVSYDGTAQVTSSILHRDPGLGVPYARGLVLADIF